MLLLILLYARGDKPIVLWLYRLAAPALVFILFLSWLPTGGMVYQSPVVAASVSLSLFIILNSFLFLGHPVIRHPVCG